MTPDLWKRVKSIYQAALDRPRAEREVYAREACGEDAALLAEVLALLAAPQDASGPIGGIVGEAAAELDMALEDHERIGPYRLLGVIGRGGMGHVYLAERADDEFEQRVAIKMANWLGGGRELTERFQLERQILANLEHPNIARLLDGGRTAAGVPYLVMEYVDGESIADYGKSGELSLPARLELFLKICEAIQYAHQQLVIHRDIKPSNVLITQDGTPKLLDFGIAKLMEPGDDAALTRADSRVLTPQYASPEQLLGAPVTTSTDVYGLGLLLYQLLSGTLPFDLSSKTSPEIQELVCQTEPAAPSRAAADTGDRPRAAYLKGDLDNIVMMALRKDPERRYTTVKEFADDIRNYLEDMPVKARSDSWAYRSGKFLRRHRLAAAATVAVVIGITGLTAYYTAQLAAERDRALEERRVAENTTNFLVDLFNVASPEESLGATITAREVLDQGAVKIRDELKEDDTIRARMLHTIGRVYERLGLYDDAQTLMEEAVTLHRQVLAPTDRMLIDSLNELAWLYYRREDWNSAKATAEEALALQHAVAGRDVPEMARTLNHLGTITYYLDDYEGSLGYYQRAIAALDHPDWLESDLRGTTLNHLGIVYATLSRFDEAEAVYEESLAIRRKVLGEEHPATATAYVNLGAFYTSTNQYDRALEYARRGLEIDRATKGDDHVDVAYDLNLLGSISMNAGDPEAALPYLQDASRIWRSAAGPNHSRYARSLDLLSDAYRQLERFDEAERDGLIALRILTESYGPDHTLTANPQYTLGKIYLDTGDLGRARSHLADALRIRTDALGMNNSEVWNAMHMLAKTELAGGDPEAALARTREAISLIETAGLTGMQVYSWLVDLRESCESALETAAGS